MVSAPAQVDAEMKCMNLAMSAACSSMLAHAMGIGVTAHNIANLNTAGFSSRRALYASGPRGSGVELYSVDIDPPAFPQEATPASRIKSTAPESLPHTACGADEAPANVDLALEMVRLIAAETGFMANANVASAQAGVYDCLLSLKV